MRTRHLVKLLILVFLTISAFLLFRSQYRNLERSWNYLDGKVGHSHYETEDQSHIEPGAIEALLENDSKLRHSKNIGTVSMMPMLSDQVASTSSETWTKPTTATAALGAEAPEQSDVEFPSSVLSSAITLSESSLPTNSQLPDRAVVIGRLPSDNTTWVSKELPQWQAAIYTFDQERDGKETTLGSVNPDVVDMIINNATIRTLPNKGMEANPYLAYIVQNYDNLPSTIAFIHAHRDGYPEAWHTDSPGGEYSNVVSLERLNIDFVQRNGYANLRCIASPGCSPPEVLPFRDPPEAHRTIEAAMPEAWREIFGNSDVPRELATPCCAQFAVSRAQILKRPLEEYRKYYRWLMQSPLKDETSGRVFEYLWHVIFGQDPVFCPDLHKCYCDVYNQC